MGNARLDRLVVLSRESLEFFGRSVLSLLRFREELLDPMHGDFSKSSSIAFYQLAASPLGWGVFLHVLCTQPILDSST